MLAFDENEQGRPWNDDDITMALGISEQLAVALQDARSVQLTEQALEEMREADRLKTQFLANMSHELRTPLNSIIGFSRVILKGIDGPVNETQSQDLNAIHDAGLHLLGLINDILDVSKIEAGKMELTFGDVDLREIVRGVMSTAVGLVKDKPIELISHVPETLPLLQADSIRVRQILLNLVSNAAKFTDQGQIEVSVGLIEDVEPARGPALRRRHRAGDRPRGSGQTFRAVLAGRRLADPQDRRDRPRAVDLPALWWSCTAARSGSKASQARAAPSSSPCRFNLRASRSKPSAAPPAPFVLAVDDDPAVLTRYRELFEGLGLRFHGLLHADGLAEFAAGMPPDMIVIDPMLPGYAGWNAVAALRRRPRPAPCADLMGSLNSEKGHAYRIHASDHRLRPTDPEELREARPSSRPRRAAGDPPAGDRRSREPSPTRSRRRSQGDHAHPVRMAASSTEAYHITRSEIPDVVVLSLMMARAEGFRALEIMRKDQRLRGTPVLVLLSAEPHPEERRQMGLYTDYIHRQGTSSPDGIPRRAAGPGPFVRRGAECRRPSPPRFGSRMPGLRAAKSIPSAAPRLPGLRQLRGWRHATTCRPPWRHSDRSGRRHATTCGATPRFSR